MQEEALITGFEAAHLPHFHHEDHLKVAWLYLKRYPLLEALAKFTQGLKHFANAHGKPQLYHEPLTWAYLLLIHQRRQGNVEDWEEFITRNKDLLSWPDSILKSYYKEETLSSARAREVFIFPDKYLPSVREESTQATLLEEQEC
jgi:hypothetical protein